MNDGEKKYRILYHHRTQGRGAEGHHIISIVKALRGMGHEVDVLSPPGIDPFELADQAPVDKAEVRTSGLQTIWKWISRKLPNAGFEFLEIGYNLTALARLRKALAGADYDIVYERYAFYLVAGAYLAKRKRIPFVLEANEVVGIPNRARPLVFERLCGRFESYLLRHTSRVLTVSSYLRQMILQQQAVDPEQVLVVPNAIDPAGLSTTPRDEELRGKLGLAGRKVIGFAGWFDKWDRLDLMIEVLERVRTAHPHVVLLLIGDGPVLYKVREQVAQRGLQDAVFYTGKVARAEVQEYLKMLDIAILPHSNNFGSPVVLFEFCGLKIPLVAPRLPPILDVMEDGNTALLFEPLDVAGCAACVMALLDDPQLGPRLAENAYRELLARHTWQRNAAHIVESGAKIP